MTQKAASKAFDVARGNTRMRFEQWAKNPSCEANTVSAVRNIRMSAVAQAEGLEDTFGQSPFALARGDQFERSLFRDGAVALVEQLIEREVLPSGSHGLVDFRLRMNGGPELRRIDDAIDATKALLVDLARGTRTDAPAVVAAPTLRIAKGVMLPEAVLIVDVLAIRTDLDRPRLVVGEVKTYPDRGGHTGAGELAGARAQAGLYVHAFDVVLDELGLRDELDVSRTGFLVLTRPGSMGPSVRANEDLEYQAHRARRGFELMEAAATALPAGLWAPDPAKPSETLIDLVRQAETTYTEACLTFCDRAQTCHAAALADQDPVVLGEDVKRFLGDVRLDRAVELLDGSPPQDDVEHDLVRRLRSADRAVS